VGDLLSTPELTIASPWLGPAKTLTDAALEIIPSQLLPLLRSDSIATPVPAGGAPTVQFTGIDGFSYAVQTSSDLVNWVYVTTNTPNDGFFYFAPHLRIQLSSFVRSCFPSLFGI